MIYIKTFELHGTIENLLQFTIYTLTEDTDDSSYIIYGSWLCKDEAISEAESHDSVYPDSNSSINIHTYNFKISKEKLIKILEIDSDDVGIYSDSELIEMFRYDIDWVSYDEFYEGVDVGHLLSLDYQNKSTDDIIDDVISRLNSELGRNWRNGFNKYTNLYKDCDGNLTFEDGNGLEYDDPDHVDYESVSIRIADHTHNTYNGRSDLCVVISNNDETKKRFQTSHTNLRYDSDSEVDDIIFDILNYWR